MQDLNFRCSQPLGEVDETKAFALLSAAAVVVEKIELFGVSLSFCASNVLYGLVANHQVLIQSDLWHKVDNTVVVIGHQREGG